MGTLNRLKLLATLKEISFQAALFNLALHDAAEGLNKVAR